MDRWAPLFMIMGLGREQLLDLSVPLMVDHVDYWSEMNGGSGG